MMNKIICNSFTEIVQKYILHMQSSSSKHMLISNDIRSELSIGFSCCNEHYLIKISDIAKRKCMLKDALINERYNELFGKNILSNSGRIEAANIVTRYIKNSIKDLDGYLELKAFW